MTTRAQKIMDAYGKVLEKSVWYNEECVVAVLRETINQLTLSNGGFNWEEEQGMMFNAGWEDCLKDIGEIADEVEALEELAQENPQVPLDAL